MTKQSLIWLSVSLAPLLIVSSFLFWHDPPPWPDEPIFVEMSKNFVSSASLRTNLYVGGDQLILDKGFGYPPIYFWTLGNWIRLFGDNIISIRLLSLLTATGSLVAFFYSAKLFFNQNNLAALATLMLSINLHLSRAARTARMEPLTLLWLILTILMTQLAIKKAKPWLLLVAAVFAAAGPLTHPMGSIIPAILGLAILLLTPYKLKQKIIWLVVVGTLVLVTNLAWLIWQYHSPQELIDTYQLLFKLKDVKVPFILTYAETSFGWLTIFGLSVAAVLALALIWLRSRQRQPLFMVITSLLLISWVIYGKEAYYLIYAQPLIILCGVDLLAYYHKIVFTLCLLFIINHLYLQFVQNDTVAIYRPDNHSVFDLGGYDYNDLNHRISQLLPANEQVTVFIASVPDVWFGLKNHPNLHFYEAPDPDFPIENANYWQALNQTDYVVFTWLPQTLLGQYVIQNTASQTIIAQPNGYMITVAKLTPRSSRHL